MRPADFDAAVIGAAGISARWGLTELTEEEAAVQRVALERTEQVIVIADGSKVGAATPIVVGAAALKSRYLFAPGQGPQVLAGMITAAVFGFARSGAGG